MKTAERAAVSLLGLHANCKSSSRRLLIFEGTMTAAYRSRKERKSGDFWAMASYMPASLHTPVAVFGRFRRCDMHLYFSQNRM